MFLDPVVILPSESWAPASKESQYPYSSQRGSNTNIRQTESTSRSEPVFFGWQI
jgi:hypothetical protein